MEENFEFLKLLAMIITTLVWISNSVFTILSFSIKIFELIKNKFGSKKIEPERDNEKDLAISNLET